MFRHRDGVENKLRQQLNTHSFEPLTGKLRVSDHFRQLNHICEDDYLGHFL
jgi:hypothetical protein